MRGLNALSPVWRLKNSLCSMQLNMCKKSCKGKECGKVKVHLWVNAEVMFEPSAQFDLLGLLNLW